MTTAFSIGQLARSAGVSVETVRYYERQNLITKPEKPLQGYRSYPQPTLARILFIKRAQALGFTLEEIRHLLVLDDAPCREVQGMATKKLCDVKAKLVDLQRLEAALSGLVKQCATNPDQNHCPIIDALQPDDQ